MEKISASFYLNDDLGARRLPDNTEYLREHRIHANASPEGRALGEEFRRRIEAGETLYLIGFLGTTHNSGLALIEASRTHGIRVLANCEEERFSGIKHYAGYPKHCAQEILRLLRQVGRSGRDVFCVCYAYDVVQEEQSGMRMLMMNSKIIKNRYYHFVTESASPTSIELDKNEVAQMRKNIFSHSPALVNVFRRLVHELDLREDICCVQMLHHENHAYFSYGVSPFFRSRKTQKPVMISCIDGGGDLSSVSLFKADGCDLDVIKRNCRANSLGVFYMLCATMLGGWSALSAEGRYMGAAAWGNGDRLTNPFYRQLRQFFLYREDGEVFVNSVMTENEYASLQEIVGPFLKMEEIWQPDAILNVDGIAHSPITQQRVDIAAAVQMVFEDALFHIIGNLIRTTRGDQLVLCGGTALNCVANMRLLEHFDEAYYQRYVGTNSRLHIWAPPIPSDQGVVVGSAYQFAMLNGATPQGHLPTPFLCGHSPSSSDIRDALSQADHVHSQSLGNVHSSRTREFLADWMAYIVARNGVIGIYQGAAETGPRALGHRSILSNACNPNTLEILNSRVKRREKIRPLAPMVLADEAHRWFHLSPGASAGDYNAYDYMVLTVKAREEAKTVIPAVIHADGTSRVQIVRKDNNPLMYDYLAALRRHVGVAVSVNTSLNVGSPIVQTPSQALEIFRRCKGIDAIFMIGDDGEVFMTYARAGVQVVDSDIPDLWNRYQSDSTCTYGEYAREVISADLVSAPARNAERKERLSA